MSIPSPETEPDRNDSQAPPAAPAEVPSRPARSVPSKKRAERQSFEPSPVHHPSLPHPLQAARDGAKSTTTTHFLQCPSRTKKKTIHTETPPHSSPSPAVLFPSFLLSTPELIPNPSLSTAASKAVRSNWERERERPWRRYLEPVSDAAVAGVSIPPCSRVRMWMTCAGG